MCVRLLLFACGSARRDSTGIHPRYPTRRHTHTHTHTHTHSPFQTMKPVQGVQKPHRHLHNNRSSHAGQSERRDMKKRVRVKMTKNKIRNHARWINNELKCGFTCVNQERSTWSLCAIRKFTCHVGYFFFSSFLGCNLKEPPPRLCRYAPPPRSSNPPKKCIYKKINKNPKFNSTHL